jgi:hypothetical protein
MQRGRALPERDAFSERRDRDGSRSQLCKALAECYFGSPDALVRLDMSEYMELHTVSKLIGAPPGYLGYNEVGAASQSPHESS